jgi:hypothetical protein
MNKYTTKNTDRNRDIIESLRKGERPRSIAERYGITLATVWQVKHKANKHGADLAKTYVIGENNITVWFKNIEAENDRNDDTWDDDEPYGPVQRCKCGLAMPCNDCLDLANYTRPVASRGWENFAIMPAGHSTGTELYGKEGAVRAK